MAKTWLTDEQVEEEIRELNEDPDVKLARAERRIKYRRRQYLYQLRDLKKKGQAIRNNPDYAWLVETYEESNCVDECC